MAEGRLDIYMIEYFEHESKYLKKIVVDANLRDAQEKLNYHIKKSARDGTYAERGPNQRSTGKVKGGSRRNSRSRSKEIESPVKGKREDRKKRQANEKQSKMATLTEKLKGMWGDNRHKDKKPSKVETRGVTIDIFGLGGRIREDESKKHREDARDRLAILKVIANGPNMEALFSDSAQCFIRCSRLSQPHLRGIQITDLLVDFLKILQDFEITLLDFIYEMVPDINDDFVASPDIFYALSIFYEITDGVETIYHENLPAISELDLTQNIEGVLSKLKTQVEQYCEKIISESLESFILQWKRIFVSNISSFSNNADGEIS
jgi:hypothetical protein